MKRDVAEAFIAELEAELMDIQKALEDRDHLLERKALLEGLISQTRRLSGDQSLKGTRHEGTSDAAPMAASLAEMIRGVLAAANEPLTAAQVYHRMQRQGWKPSKAGREVVRGILIRRKDMFRRVGKLFGLKGWKVQWAREEGEESSAA